MPSSASSTPGSNTSHASGAPSRPCLGASERSFSEDSTTATGVTSKLIWRASLARRSVAPPAGEHLAVAVEVRTEGEELEPIRAGLERADHLWLHADRVEAIDLERVVVELDPARSA